VDHPITSKCDSLGSFRFDPYHERNRKAFDAEVDHLRQKIEANLPAMSVQCPSSQSETVVRSVTEAGVTDERVLSGQCPRTIVEQMSTTEAERHSCSASIHDPGKLDPLEVFASLPKVGSFADCDGSLLESALHVLQDCFVHRDVKELERVVLSMEPWRPRST